MVPLADGQGLAIGITSYDGGVFYGFNARPRRAAGRRRARRTVDEALDELRATVRTEDGG